LVLLSQTKNTQLNRAVRMAASDSLACNVTGGSVTIQSNIVSCNGASHGQRDYIAIVGSNPSQTILVSNSYVIIALDDVSARLTVDSGDVSIHISGENEFTGGIRCRGGANLTFSAPSAGTLSARSAGDYAGIGSEPNGICGSLIFVNGTYIVESTNGAGIGSGNAAPTSQFGRVAVYDGIIKATSENGAGIGTGYSFADAFNSMASATSVGDAVAIFGGDVTATSSQGAGIGTGYAQGDSYAALEVAARNTLAEVSLSGGNISATGQQRGAGIGSGRAGADGASASATNTVALVEIIDGNVSATSVAGAGIGPGGTSGTGDSSSSVSALSIVGGTVWTASTGGAAIGAIPTIDISNGSIVGTTALAQIGPAAWTISGSPEFSFDYSRESSRENLTGIPLLHFGSLSLPNRTVCLLTIREISGTFERTVVFDGTRATGCVFSVPRVGMYRVSIELASPPIRALLGHGGDLSFAVNEVADNFYESVEAVLATATPIATPSVAFVESDALPHTIGVKGSGHLALSHEVAHSSALLPSGELSAASNRETSSGIPLVGIIVPVVAVVVVIVVLIIVRHRATRSGDGPAPKLLEQEAAGSKGYATGEFVTACNPCGDEMSDEVFE
jgi:hypothetical protein